MATEYVVLTLPKPTPSNQSMSPQFLVVDKVSAASSDAAIRAVAEKNGSGTYAAVPARSWEPRTVIVETKKAVTFAKEQT